MSAHDRTWKPGRKTRYTSELRKNDMPCSGEIGMLIAVIFAGRDPTIRELMNKFDMSRSTAHRWRRLWREVREQTA